MRREVVVIQKSSDKDMTNAINKFLRANPYIQNIQYQLSETRTNITVLIAYEVDDGLKAAGLR